MNPLKRLDPPRQERIDEFMQRLSTSCKKFIELGTWGFESPARKRHRFLGLGRLKSCHWIHCCRRRRSVCPALWEGDGALALVRDRDSGFMKPVKTGASLRPTRSRGRHSRLPDSTSNAAPFAEADIPVGFGEFWKDRTSGAWCETQSTRRTVGKRSPDQFPV